MTENRKLKFYNSISEGSQQQNLYANLLNNIVLSKIKQKYCIYIFIELINIVDI